MRRQLFSLLILAISAICGVQAAAEAIAPTLSLTPVPYRMKVGKGELVMPAGYTVSVAGLDKEYRDEADKFVKVMNTASALNGSVTDNTEATIVMSMSSDETIGDEGYYVKVAPDSPILVQANTPAGFFYAFQTIKKMLPPNVMAGVADADVTEYALPEVEITDKPRFGFRGLEIDCARHFFELDELKRMLDVMSYYKMNRLHWHLTDDQGWRIEIKKYPKLLQKATTAPNAYWYDFDNRYQYHTNAPYGPYYYTVEQMKEIVAYAKNLHIEVMPEIEMPGHMVAAINAYPEFSCTPESEHAIWYTPGISRDVLNVSSPAVLQFCKDVLTEVAEIFPYEYIHIGGDETPTSAWESNADCQAMMQREGFTSPHQLQSLFTKKIADHIKSLGKKTVCWNEVITASGADTKLAQDADLMIYGWLNGGSEKATELGLHTVWCHTGYYYLDYGQSDAANEPRFMGYVRTLETVYNAAPIPDGTSKERQALYLGVQGNLWTEYIAEPKHLEYMAMPRMMAIAETGWSTQGKKNFTKFQQRITADTTLLNYNNYTYCRHHLTGAGETPAAQKVYPEPGKWYRLITRVTHDSRSGRVLEMVQQGSQPNVDHSAPVNSVWSAILDESNPFQLWRFDEDPANPGVYALVNKGAQQGSVNPNAGSTSIDARWKYDTEKVNYNFLLGENTYYGQLEDGSYYYSIRSNKNSGYWLNCGQAGAKFAINCWSNPADGNGGLWICMPEEGIVQEDVIYPAFDKLEPGSFITLTNTTDLFKGMMVADLDGTSPYATYSDDAFSGIVWRVESNTVGKDNSQTLHLTNMTTGRSLGSSANDAVSSISSGFFSGNMGYPVQMGDAGDIVVYRNTDADDYTVAAGIRNIYPISRNAEKLQGAISSGSTIPGQKPGRIVGSAWMVRNVNAVQYEFKDQDGKVLATGYAPYNPATDKCPEIKGYKLTDSKLVGDKLTAVYTRVEANLIIDARDRTGAIVDIEPVTCPIGQSIRLEYPEVPYFKMVEADKPAGTELTLNDDMTINATYVTDGFNGVVRAARPVTEIQDGHSYLIYDAHPARAAFRGVNTGNGKIYGSAKADNVGSAYTWVLEADNGNYLVRNMLTGLYAPALVSGSSGVMSEQGEPFRFSYNADEASWSIQGTSNNLYWNGNDGALELAGWTVPHPYQIMEYVVAPDFKLTFECVDDNGELLQSSTAMVLGGNSYIWAAPEIKGYSLKSVSGYDMSFNAIDSHKTVTAVYTDNSGVETIAAEPDGKTVPDAIYDLQGRRVQRVTTPGLYIVNGAKLLVR